MAEGEPAYSFAVMCLFCGALLRCTDLYWVIGEDNETKVERSTKMPLRTCGMGKGDLPICLPLLEP